MASDYPKRPSHFANKFCRLLTKSAAAQDLGPEVCWLLTVVVQQEDSKHYRAPVTYYNEQLMPLCGFGGRSRLVTARDKAVAAGWLHYEGGGKGVPGRYWVLIPESYINITDSPCDESESDLSSRIGTANGQEYSPESGRQPDGNGQTRDFPDNDLGRQTDGKRTATGRQPDGKPASSSPIPNPNPKEESSSCPDSGEPDGQNLEPPKRRLSYEPADMELARHILNGVHLVIPNAKHPNLDAWANEIRLTRERDGPDRTHENIRELFDWANRDSFWSANILSPATLRKQWDRLTAKRNANSNHRSERDNTGTDASKPGRGHL